jgi:hypothetical protein
MQHKREPKDRIKQLDGRQSLIALAVVLEGRTIEEALKVAESSVLWTNLESHIGIISQETI